MIVVAGCSKSFGDPRRGTASAVLDRIDLTVQAREFVCLLGPSGCGKTTILRILAGLLRPDAGSVTIDGRLVTGPGPDRGMVFQDFALLPWADVVTNVAFGLEVRGLDRLAREARARTFVETVGLGGFEHHFPQQLSGGMQQRVGLARALASDPEVMLMDEPLGALDALTREQIQELILDLWWKTRKMFFFITHSVEEALFLATELIVMTPSPGRIAHRYELDFGRRFVECRDARQVKSDPEFIRLREDVLHLIHAAAPSEPAAA